MLKIATSSSNHHVGTLYLTAPVNVAHLMLPQLLAPFIKRYLDIKVEVMVESGIVDFLSAGCDAGICYDDWLE
ncbi:LysR substrate-binding domain-containing protein [Sodalis sp.]|uniref:LysR substrate-binding domain-containing protein n=1 Tax=Sodalis sp. (in: enterobacteria) TaxID=1898979 RepID=UPI00387395D6